MAIIAFVGPFGSGCTAIADILTKEKQYKRVSLDAVVREDYYKVRGRHPASRTAVYDFADEQRLKHGSDYFAKLTLDPIKGANNLIIDDMKHVSEVRYAKLKFPKIIIFGIQAETDARWERLKESYHGDKTAFDQDNTREQGIEGGMYYRQNVNACFAKSNVIVNNKGGVIVDGNPYTEKLKSVILEKIEWYTKHPPSEAAPEFVDVAVDKKKWDWKLGPKGMMALLIVLSAVIGGGIFSVIGYAISPQNAVTLTTVTHVGIGFKVGAVICLIGLIIFGKYWKERKSDTPEEDDDPVRRRYKLR